MNVFQKGADELLERLTNAMKGSSGDVHPQSLICALGSLAGYACQQDVRDVYISRKHLTESQVFTIVRDKQGRKYFFGDLLNEPLVNEKYCIWAFIGGAVKKLGGSLPDVNDIFRYISYVVGGEQFGKVRSCETGDNMQGYLGLLKEPMFAAASKYADAGELHIVFGIALQKAVYACGKVINPSEAARIAMESAVSMSKIDRI